MGARLDMARSLSDVASLPSAFMVFFSLLLPPRLVVFREEREPVKIEAIYDAFHVM